MAHGKSTVVKAISGVQVTPSVSMLERLKAKVQIYYSQASYMYIDKSERDFKCL